jgi:hypothetical protein
MRVEVAGSNINNRVVSRIYTKNGATCFYLAF